MSAKALYQQLEEIAKQQLGVETLRPRGRDHLDFPEISVSSLFKGLLEAYRLGRGESITPAVGTRVRVRLEVDRYADFVVPVGTTGVVTRVDMQEGVIAVKADQKVDGAEEWNNEIEWNYQHSYPLTVTEEFWENCEPIADSKQK